MTTCPHEYREIIYLRPEVGPPGSPCVLSGEHVWHDDAHGHHWVSWAQFEADPESVRSSAP